MTKLLTLDILFSTEIRVAVVTKLVILGISPLTYFILALREALVAKLVISGILSSIFSILALHISFLMTSVFTKSLSLTGIGINSSTPKLSTLLFNLLKPLGTFYNLSISNLSTSHFKLAQSSFASKRWCINSCCIS